MRRLLCLPIAAVVVLSSVSMAYAMWADVPMENLLAEAELVVVGKIVKVEAGFARGGRDYDLAEIQIAEFLKGGNKITSVKLAFPTGIRRGGGAPMPMIAVSTDIRYREGQEGVWILEKDKEKDCYWATYPKDFQPMTEKAEVVNILKELSNLSWGEPQKGLQVALLVKEDTRTVTPGPGRPTRILVDARAFVFFRNASDKSFHFSSYPGDAPIVFDIKRPDGKQEEINPFKSGGKGISPISAHNFIRLEPGRIAPLWNYAFLPLKDLISAGTYEIAAVYRNENDGAAFNLENVFTGTVKSPFVPFRFGRISAETEAKLGK